MKIRTYSELIALPTFLDRYEYLRLNGKIGDDTFGFDRYLNQIFYRSDEWKKTIRREIILRDNGCDLASADMPVPDGVRIYIHHMNPITKDDILNRSDFLMNPEYLITTVKRTHDAIHYGNASFFMDTSFAERSPHDTCPWKMRKL